MSPVTSPQFGHVDSKCTIAPVLSLEMISHDDAVTRVDTLNQFLSLFCIIAQDDDNVKVYTKNDLLSRDASLTGYSV